MLYHKSFPMLWAIFCLNDQSFKVFYLAGNFLIFCLENEKSCVDVFDVALVLFFKIDFSGLAFYPRGQCSILGSVIIFKVPDIEMKPFKIDIKNFRLIGHDCKKLFKVHLVLLFVNFELLEDEMSIFFYKGGDIIGRLEIFFAYVGWD